MKQFSEANGYHHQVQVRRKHSRSRSLGESIKVRTQAKSCCLSISCWVLAIRGSWRISGGKGKQFQNISSATWSTAQIGLEHSYYMRALELSSPDVISLFMFHRGDLVREANRNH